MASLKSILIGLVFVGLFVGVFMISAGGFSTSYNTNFDNSTFTKYQKMQQINNDMENISDQMQIKEESNLFDIFGAYFRGGYAAVRTTTKSIDILTNTKDGLVSDMVEDLNLGSSGSLFLTAFSVIILIVIILGFLMKVIFKGEP